MALLLGDDLDARTSLRGDALVLAAAALWRGDPLTGFPLHAWAVFAASATISQLAGVVGIVWALAHLRATFAAVVLLAQPVGTALLGWWWLGEALTPLQLCGGALVLAGIAAASRAPEATADRGSPWGPKAVVLGAGITPARSGRWRSGSSQAGGNGPPDPRLLRAQ